MDSATQEMLMGMPDDPFADDPILQRAERADKNPPRSGGAAGEAPPSAPLRLVSPVPRPRDPQLALPLQGGSDQDAGREAAHPGPGEETPGERVGSEGPPSLPREAAQAGSAGRAARASEAREPESPPPARPGTAAPAPAAQLDLNEGIPWAAPKPLTIRPRTARTSAPHAGTAAGPASPDPAAPDDDPLAGWKPTLLGEEFAGTMPQRTEPLGQRLVRAVREHRAVQLAVAGLVLIVIALAAFQPWAGAPGVTLAELKRHPARYSGRSVRVRGRVGEVFPMGAGYTFYLLQGRDTMAVYTRYRRPLEGERIDLMGTLQTGVLDGATRLALFEQAK